MKKVLIDCSAITSEMQFWELYAEAISPEGIEHFGYNLDAFNDAITAGGPGWPGGCEISFIHMARVHKFRSGAFYRRLQEIAEESRSVRIILEPLIAPKKAWWNWM